ncbi:MAG: hypothetical protein JW929_03710 [Anaerolineales bacterium]|nr:hypothetical protein [Anaerolineales bacterium]
MAADKESLKPAWRAHWPLLAVLALAAVLLGIALAGQTASGRVMLAEEDAYQRLALAKNLAQGFAWEIVPGEFASAFGTLLWPILLAPVFFLLGADALWAWIFNALLSAALIVLAYRAVRKAVAAPLAQALLLAVLIIALPLAPLAASGMEHVLFLVLLLAFLELWARRMQSPAEAGFAPLCVLAALLAATRYEGLLVAAIAGFFLLLRRDWRAGLLIPCAAALPTAVFGFFSWRAGWLPVPASVYLRRAELIPADLSAAPAVVFRSLNILGLNPGLRALVLVAALLPAWLGFTGRLGPVRERGFFAPALAVLVILADLTLIGDLGYRYDAWLILLGCWAVLPGLGKILPADLRALRDNTVSLLAGAGLAVLIGFPLLHRGVQGAIQFGESLERYQGVRLAAAGWIADCGSGIVATDSPGTVVFLAGKDEVVDLTGFVGLAAFRERRGGELSAEWMRSEAERSGACAALIFQPVIQVRAAQVWIRAGGWVQAECAACGSAEIFLVREDDELRRCTDAFLADLPDHGVVRKLEGGK